MRGLCQAWKSNRTFVPLLLLEQHTQQKQLKNGRVYLAHSLNCLVHHGCKCVAEQISSHSKRPGDRVLLEPGAGITSKGLALWIHSARQSSTSKGPMAFPNSFQLRNRCINNEPFGNIIDSSHHRQQE